MFVCIYLEKTVVLRNCLPQDQPDLLPVEPSSKQALTRKGLDLVYIIQIVNKI